MGDNAKAARHPLRRWPDEGMRHWPKFIRAALVTDGEHEWLLTHKPAPRDLEIPLNAWLKGAGKGKADTDAP